VPKKNDQPAEEKPQVTIIGHNSEAAARLATYVERIERVRAEKKEAGAQEAAIVAEAKAAGYHGGAIKAVVKIRSMKPHERAENEAILDTYLHAMGMASEPPLFRQIGLIGADITSRDSVIEAMKHLVPQEGSITVETKDGKPVKLMRDKDGNVAVVEVAPPPANGGAAPQVMQRPAAEPPPNVSPQEAEALGAQAFKDNVPIISNPFPFGDERRPRWDKGWRDASGGDGMGPGGD
jgi:uncharacterized protein (UPF0335 family)